MKHKHLNLQELLELSTFPEKKDTLHLDDCSICETRLSKADFLLSKLKEKELSSVDNIYNEVKPGINIKDDFLAFIGSSALAKEKKNKHIQKAGIKRVRFKYTRYVAAGLLAACLLIVVNFKYYLLIPDEKFVNTSAALNISRKGLIAGKTDLLTGAILIGRDEVTNETDDLFIESGRGMKLFIKKKSRFSFNEMNDIFSASLLKGRYFINFDKTSGKKYTVELPLNCKVIITGTQAYFNADENKYSIYLKEGKSELQFDEKKPVELKTGFQYNYSENKVLDLQQLSAEESAELLQPFAGIEGFDKYMPNKDQSTDEKGQSDVKKSTSSKKKLTINDLKKKYGTLSIITTKDNKKYIGAFKITGNRIEIITTGGLITLPSSKVKNLSPYRK